MSPPEILTQLGDLALRWKILIAASAIVVIELGFRRLAPSSRAYVAWSGFFRGLGVLWTAVILSIVYVLSVGPIGLAMRLGRHDPLDRALRSEPSFWRTHEPNPLGALRAARHQF